jgi:hypothetical protein
VVLPAGLQSLIFGQDFHQSVENVALPASFQSIRCSDDANQSLMNVALPADFQSRRCGYASSNGLDNWRAALAVEHAALPAGPQSLSLAITPAKVWTTWFCKLAARASVWLRSQSKPGRWFFQSKLGPVWINFDLTFEWMSRQA